MSGDAVRVQRGFMTVLLLKVFFIASILTDGSALAEDSWGDLLVRENCNYRPNEPVLTDEDFAFNQSFEEVIKKGLEHFFSEKRLPHRAFYDSHSNRVHLPVMASSSPRPLIEVSPNLIRSVQKHIEKALELNYVDVISFSDMGHTHFFIPDEAVDELTTGGESNLAEIRFEKISADPRVKMLYHTAEQIRLLDDEKQLLLDRHLQWRFFTRNLIGDNQGKGELELIHNESHHYNTARDYKPGYRYWGSGFYLSAQKDGCFRYNHLGEERAFDINLVGPRSQDNIR